MMKTTVFFIFVVISVNVFSQNNSQTLINNTWRISSLVINNELFNDTLGTCVYSTEISFINDSIVILKRPCINTTSQIYSVKNNLLILDHKDTLTITNINTVNFETQSKQKFIDERGTVYSLKIITLYEKQ